MSTSLLVLIIAAGPILAQWHGSSFDVRSGAFYLYDFVRSCRRFAGPVRDQLAAKKKAG